MEPPNPTTAGPLHSWKNLFRRVEDAGKALTKGIDQMGPQTEGLPDLLQVLEEECCEEPANELVVNGMIRIIAEKFDMRNSENREICTAWTARMRRSQPLVVLSLISAIDDQFEQ